MALLPKMTKDMAIIQKLDDEPNDVGGLTAAQLKAKFDEAGETIKAYLNETLIPAIDEAIEATNAKINGINIYGVRWDGTSSSMIRTDNAAGFADPVPYVAGAASYGSPFDNLMPWAGMKRVTDSEAGELVSIPKYWYKWTKSGDVMTLQISPSYVSGFHVSPAHADRGDGKGERDVVYVGRYHCCGTYKSTTGELPIASITRAEARSGISALGSTVWQSDFAMFWTIRMLYLVEYADWEPKEKIARGNGKAAAEAVGASDSMPYHTGTMQTSRDTYSVGVQYRYIEGLWDNVRNWMDGCYYSAAGLSVIMNPASFSDTENGTVVGIPFSDTESSSAVTHGYPKTYAIPSVSGLEWALYPSEVWIDQAPYDWASLWYFEPECPCLCCGDCYYPSLQGLFRISCLETTYENPTTGCRLMKLP